MISTIATNGSDNEFNTGKEVASTAFDVTANNLANAVDTEQYLTELFSKTAGTIILPLRPGQKSKYHKCIKGLRLPI